MKKIYVIIMIVVACMLTACGNGNGVKKKMMLLCKTLRLNQLMLIT